MLEQFRKAKAQEIRDLRQNYNSLPPPFTGSRASFAKALKKDGLAVIAEFKRASPSRGIIRPDLRVEDAVLSYQRGGAAAISVLTEEKWFKGSFGYLDRAVKALRGELPVLRKDFIFDPVQIRATASTPASAILIIVRSTPTLPQLRDLLAEARKWQLESVVEVFDQADVDLARQADARIIQVNARNLATLETDRHKALKVIQDNPPLPHEVWIFASGISEAAHLRAAREAGFDACLIGSSLMAQVNPGEALQNLLKDAENAC